MATRTPPAAGSPAPAADPTPDPPAPEGCAEVPSRWVLFGLANLVVVVVVSVASWYLLADPELSPWSFYPLPFNAALFWAILFVVFIGFNAEFAGSPPLVLLTRFVRLVFRSRT